MIVLALLVAFAVGIAVGVIAMGAAFAAVEHERGTRKGRE